MGDYYGSYKSRNDLTKDELLVSLTRIQEIKRWCRNPSLDPSDLSPLNTYHLTATGSRDKALPIPYINTLSAAHSSECTKEFRDNMAGVAAKLVNVLKTIETEILSLYHEQQDVIAKEEAALIERLKLVSSSQSPGS